MSNRKMPVELEHQSPRNAIIQAIMEPPKANKVKIIHVRIDAATYANLKALKQVPIDYSTLLRIPLEHLEVIRNLYDIGLNPSQIIGQFLAQGARQIQGYQRENGLLPVKLRFQVHTV